MNLVTKQIDEPTSDAEMEARRARGKGAIKISVLFNERTAIGGLCLLKDREPHHEIIAAMFKNDYERLYGQGLGATDPSKQQVDVSKIAHDAGMAVALDRSERLTQARKQLSGAEYDLICGVVNLALPLSKMVPRQPSAWQHKKAMSDKKQELFNALEHLGEIWGLVKRS